MLGVALWGLGAVLVAFTLLWLWSLRRVDASIADPFWGPAFLLVGLAYAVAAGGTGARGFLALASVAAWAARLGSHLLARNRAHGEDPRYRAMRARYGASFPVTSLFIVFWLQGGLLWVVSWPVLAAVTARGALGALDALGVVLFLTGFITEGVADRQLARFRSDPDSRGKVLDTGLWRFSRHPNYFGDAVLWWGIGCLGAAAGAWWTLMGPALMTFLLMRVSGVPLLEEGLRRSRPGYEAYARRTSAFVPWPPRKD